MQGHRLGPTYIRLNRVQASIVIGLAVTMCMVGFVPGAPAVAASGSVSELRRAFRETFISVRATRTSASCSLATAQGRISLIEMMRGQERYLQSTTCAQAFLNTQESPAECGTVPQLQFVIKSAIVRVKGKRATIQLVEDIACTSEGLVGGAAAVRRDPMGISHWIEHGGRWLFNNEPTGTYSPAGMKAAAQLRAALSGRSITEGGPPQGLTLTAPFCANGTTPLVVRAPDGETAVEAPVFWYVAAGLSASGQYEPPFDPQGDPQGAVFVPANPHVEWGVKLVSGVLAATSPPNVALPVGAPGSAGC